MKINRRILCGPALFISLAGLSIALSYAPARQEAIKVTFTDATKSAGIDFVNKSSSEKKYIVESMGGGVAMFDFDNDGRLDIYLVNSYTVDAALAKKPRPHAALYRHPGTSKFEDIAAKPRVADPGCAIGVSLAKSNHD